MTRREAVALKSLKKQQANTNSTSRQGKLHGVVERVHLQGEDIQSARILRKDPTSQLERKIRKLLTKHKTVLPSALKHKLAPYYSKPLTSMDFPRYTILTSHSDQQLALLTIPLMP
jgi:hypothetical protein